MLVLKLSSVGVGVAGILVAFAFMSVQSALDAWWALASIFSGGMLGLFLLGYISKKARNFDAVLGVVLWSNSGLLDCDIPLCTCQSGYRVRDVADIFGGIPEC